MDEYRHTKAYAEGFAAGEAGITRQNNPYDKEAEMDEWSDWLYGWEEAVSDFEQGERKMSKQGDTLLLVILFCIVLVVLALIDWVWLFTEFTL